MPGATNTVRVARLTLVVTALSLATTTGCDETSDSGPSQGGASGGAGGRPDAAPAGGGAGGSGAGGAAGGGGADGGVVDAPSGDDSGRVTDSPAGPDSFDGAEAGHVADAGRAEASDGSSADRADAARADSSDAAQRIVLFDGTNMNAWAASGGGNARWPIVAGGAFEVLPGSGDIHTRQAFGDALVHLEFWIPMTPATNAEQDRGNSGVYLQGRYEVQILDSFNHPLSGMNDCASIYGVKDADSNEATPPETWQTYDIVFRAARYNGNTKTENARISVTWNGKEVQHEVEVPGPTGSGDPESPASGGIRLQDHGHLVRFRNFWVQPI